MANHKEGKQMQPDDAVFALTASQLVTWMTVINFVITLLVAIMVLIGYYFINKCITRLNSRITDTHSQVADRAMALAQSMGDLAYTMMNGAPKSSDINSKIDNSKSADVVSLQPGNDRNNRT